MHVCFCMPPLSVFYKNVVCYFQSEYINVFIYADKFILNNIGMEVKPCKGEKPLTDPLTARELDCGNGPFRQDCPAGSYCHQTAKFAKCCRKSKFI